MLRIFSLKLLDPFIFRFVLFIPFFHFLLIIMDFHMLRLLDLRFLQASELSSHFPKGLSMFIQSLKDLLCHCVFHGGSHCFSGGLFLFLVCVFNLYQALSFSQIQMGVGTCFLDFDGAMMPKKKSPFLLSSCPN